MKTSRSPDTSEECPVNWSEHSRIVGPCIRPGGTLLTERALALCNLTTGSRIAEIGCGAGGTLEYFEKSGDYCLVGLDCSEALLAEAGSRFRTGHLVRGLAEALPFSSNAFDAVVCECVLSILSDRITTLRECSRVLKEGGYLIVSDVISESCLGLGALKGTLEPLTKDDLLNLLAEFGFTLLLWEEHKKLLKEFAVRMIFAGVTLPGLWGCSRKGDQTNRVGTSYFLMVARKSGSAFQPFENNGSSYHGRSDHTATNSDEKL